MIKLVAMRPVLYATIVIASVALTYAYKLRTAGIFACTAAGYPADGYLGYCNASAYGDYDHGALWFGMEPEVTRAAADADVLFLGNSRMQFGFSTQATDDWFAAAGARHYLLGFSHLENETFTSPLLARIKPRARVYVINADRFFDDVASEPGGAILHGADMQRRYHEKQLWQKVHRAVCVSHPAVCGSELAFYRFRNNGHWQARNGRADEPQPTADAAPEDQDHWSHYAALAEQFIATLPVSRDCVILTVVPSPSTRSAEASALADALRIRLVNPQVPGLQTFDETHLGAPSAERWSKAFFDVAGAQIRACLAGTNAAPAA